jgi:hypothetical protein
MVTAVRLRRNGTYIKLLNFRRSFPATPLNTGRRQITGGLCFFTHGRNYITPRMYYPDKQTVFMPRGRGVESLNRRFDAPNHAASGITACYHPFSPAGYGDENIVFRQIFILN